MRLNKVRVFCLCLLLSLIAAVPTSAQDFRGRINGTVTDNSGAVLPGVTVTASSPALIQAQVQVSGAEGEFRFQALPPGVYEVTFELPGFQTIKREGIRVVINQTLTVDQQMQVATLQETVTVTGESPIVDTSTTTLGTNFTKELLTEIPNARDVWAAMSQAPGIQMNGYDVGGSHAGSQTGYVTYGLNVQNQTKIEGIDTSEGVSANAGYFDFGSFEEFQIGGAGNSAESFAPGASLNVSVKSGGDRLSGNWYSDFENDSTISDNVPSAFTSANTADDDGFFTRTPLVRGNPITKQYDLNFNVGGPLWRGKLWAFYSYRLNDQYKAVVGITEEARSKLTNDYTAKLTYQLNQNNQIIGFINKRNKLQDKRGLGLTTPLSATTFQASRNYPSKIEWTSVIGSRMFLDVLYGDWKNFFPLRPALEAGTYEGPWGPGRLDTGTQQRFDGGGTDSYQNQKRFKPQFYVSMSYFKDGWAGSHDFKFGYDWKRDRRNFFRDQPFDLFYRDLNGGVNQVDLYNTPVSPINQVEYNAGWINDTWKLSRRLTLTLGGRLERYTDGWPEQQFAPNGHPMLANFGDPAYRNFVSPRTIAAETVAKTTTFSPRAGFAYDLFGDNRTVVKAFYGQFRYNSADIIADKQNPVGRAQLRYQFNDLNGNRQLDGPQELGRLVQTVGGAGFVRIDPDLERPTVNELSTSIEREVTQGLSARFSYVYKNIRNEWGEVDAARLPLYGSSMFEFVDIGRDGVRGSGDDRTLLLPDIPANSPSDRFFTNPDDPANKADFNTIEFGLNRRFAGRWMVLTSFGYTWSKAFYEMLSPTAATSVAGNQRWGDDTTLPWLYRPAQQMFGDRGRETTTTWNYKLVGRYVFPLDIGISGSWKVQSGYNWARVTSVPFPGDGAQDIRMEPMSSNRSPNVAILDLRFDKSFQFGRFGRLTGQIDVFNLTNSGVVTNFRTTTAAVSAANPLGTFQEVIALLDPRIVRFGLRFDF